MRHQRRDVAGVRRHQRERRHGAAAAGEHLDRTGAELLDHAVHILGLDGRRVVDPAIFARAAPDSARVVGDHRAIREVRRQRREAGGVHRLPDHEQRGPAVRRRQRAAHVIDDLGVRSDQLAGLHMSHRRVGV
jgi:hypothetical protein